MNALHHHQMIDDERLAQMGETLAAGVIRMVARKSSPLAPLYAHLDGLQTTGDEATCPAAGSGRQA